MLLAAALAVGGCTGTPAALSPLPSTPSTAAAPACATAEVTIRFDFEGAAPARCVIDGPRAFTLVIGPEHAPPINPSPWYAFRYKAAAGAPVRLTLAYLGAKHRYVPKLTDGGRVTELAAKTTDEGQKAQIDLPAGEGMVSGQPLVGADRYAALAGQLERDFSASRFQLGASLDGRAIEGVRFGDETAPRLIILLGRQHPPEVTGSYAMEPFLLELAAVFRADPDLGERYQVLAVPLLNPDGVALGHWRANRGGVDLNRDWGPFTQPETRAVRDWLDALPRAIRPAVMIDFHSTGRNLFYVQGQEATPAQAQFVTDWLGGRERTFAGYPFTIERTNANPGSGTSKNWFHATYGVPALTYEVGDETGEAGAASAAKALARTLVPALDRLGTATAGQ